MLMSRQKTLVEIIPAFGVIRISDLRSLESSWCIKKMLFHYSGNMIRQG